MSDNDTADNRGLDELTAGEKAYLDSGGEKTEGLIAENPGTAGTPAPTSQKTSAEPAKPSPDGAAKPAADAQPSAQAKPGADKDAGAAAKPGAEDDHESEEVETPGKPKRRMVDYRALRDARTKTKELEAALAKEKEDRGKDNEARARVDERLRLLNEALAPEGAAAPGAVVDEDPEPDPEADIFAHNKWLGRQLKKANDENVKTRQSVQINTEAAQVREYYRSDALRFAATEPNFKEAYEHLLNTRGAQLRLQGYEPKDIPGMVVAEERELVKRALSQKKSPAELIFGLAKSFGFAPKAPGVAVNPKPGDQAAGNLADVASGAAKAVPGAPGADAAKPATNVTEEIDRIIAGVDASKSLSTAGGGTSNPLSLEVLANLSDAEFSAVYKKHGKEIDKLLGQRAN